jgi:hypothetical protein
VTGEQIALPLDQPLIQTFPNGPAIGDLMNLFNFHRLRPDAPPITPIVPK